MTPEQHFESKMESFRHGIFRASMDHYLGTGKLSGSMLLQVREMLSSFADQQLSDYKERLRKAIQQNKEPGYIDRTLIYRESDYVFACDEILSLIDSL